MSNIEQKEKPYDGVKELLDESGMTPGDIETVLNYIKGLEDKNKSLEKNIHMLRKFPKLLLKTFAETDRIDLALISRVIDFTQVILRNTE